MGNRYAVGFLVIASLAGGACSRRSSGSGSGHPAAETPADAAAGPDEGVAPPGGAVSGSVGLGAGPGAPVAPPAGCLPLWTLGPDPDLAILGSALVGDLAGHIVVYRGGFHVLVVARVGRANATSLGIRVAPEGPAGPEAAVAAPRPVGAMASAGDRFVAAFGTTLSDSMTLRARAVMPEGRMLPPGPSGGAPVFERSGDPRMAAAAVDLALARTELVLLVRSSGAGGPRADWVALTPAGTRIAGGEAAVREGSAPLRAFGVGRDVVLLGGQPDGGVPVRCFSCPDAVGPADSTLGSAVGNLEPAWVAGVLKDRAVVGSAGAASDAGPASHLFSVRPGREVVVEPFAFADGWMPAPGEEMISSGALLWRVARPEGRQPSAVGYDRTGAVARDVPLPAGAIPLAVSDDGNSMLVRDAAGPGSLALCSTAAAEPGPPVVVDWRAALDDASPPGGRCDGR